MHPHRSNALHGAAAVLTVTLRRGVTVSLSWSWSHRASGPRVGSCIRAPLNFHPYPVQGPSVSRHPGERQPLGFVYN